SLFDTFARSLTGRGMFDDFFSDDMAMGGVRTTIPAVNIEETDTDLIINVAAPGMNKKDFKVEIDNNQLHIGYKKESQTDNKQNRDTGNSHWRKEYNFESFDRTFTLPAIVEGDKIEASYQDGILAILIPKKEEARRKPAKAIE